jgi:23S rRNA (uracil1939-C5)-methyltransferase
MPYDEITHTGDIRHLYTRVADGTGELMVCVVTRGDSLPFADALVDALRAANENIVSIVQNVNPHRTNAALGEREILLWGKRGVADTVGGLTFEIAPKAFYQVNSAQTKVLYDTVVRLADFTGEERVLDLYCGIGTISLYVAGHVKSVAGVECVGDAVDNAVKNAELNGVKNAVFYKGAAEEVCASLGDADVVIVDPPRKGCDRKLLDAIGSMANIANRLVYVSCNPATLARDVKILAEYGYEITAVQPVDMFPRTAHVETVVLMARVD